MIIAATFKFWINFFVYKVIIQLPSTKKLVPSIFSYNAHNSFKGYKADSWWWVKKTKIFLSNEFKLIQISNLAAERVGLNIDLSGSKCIFSRPALYVIQMIGVIVWAIALYTYAMENLTDVDKILAAVTINSQLFTSSSKHFIFLARRKRLLRLNEALERLALTGEYKTSLLTFMPLTISNIIIITSSFILFSLTTALVKATNSSVIYGIPQIARCCRS